MKQLEDLEIKGKVFLCLTKHHTMKTYWEEYWLKVFSSVHRCYL